MTAPTVWQPSPTARRWFAANAALAWLGLLVSLTITALAPYPYAVTVPSRYGYGVGQGADQLGARLADWISYFTIWSNLTVAIVTTLLAAGRLRPTFRAAAARLDALLMITVTGLVYAVVLAPTTQQRGWENVSNSLLHQITPVLTIVVWVVVGPRGWFRRATAVGALGIPLAWVVWMLLRGAATGTYPYPFVDVAKLGLGAVLINVVAILAFGMAIAAGYVGLDRWLGRRAEIQAGSPAA